MRVRAGLVAFMLAMVMALVGCTGGSDPTSGTRLANGLHDLSDGTVVGLGVLEWSDLEGGFYVLTGSPDGGGTIAVIANPDDFADDLQALVGATVQVTGMRAEGASSRMGGPEVVIDSIAEVTDTPGPAE